MADTEAKKILTGLWADGGDRIDPDDATLTPVLDRDTGWTAPFSASDGNTPRRQVVNQRFRELDGAASDSMRWGLLQYDADIDYHQHARVAVDDREFRAATENGPNTTAGIVGPTAAGQTAWVEVAGVVGLPSAPAAPQATSPRSGELDWFWDCPLDGGAKVLRFDFEWRPAGTAAWTRVSVMTARAPLTSLVNGQAVEARVRAINSVGEGPWSSIGSVAPQGTIPDGGSSLALRADGGDTEAALDWLEPDDGGLAIIGYTVQWRTAGQAFGLGREVSVASTTTIITALVNGIEVFFRVRAVNNQGNGNWSNEASATPAEAPPAEAVPDRAAAPAGFAGNGEATWVWSSPSDNGADIASYEFRYRAQGAALWQPTRVVGLPVRAETSLVNGTVYEAQVRATNSVGTQSDWSPSGTVTPAAEVPGQVQLVALSNTAGAISADWGEPDANGDPITGYSVQIANNASFVAAVASTVSGTAASFSGIADGQTRFVRVRAVNGAGMGAWSPSASIVRDDGVAAPDAPSLPEGISRRPLVVDWAFNPVASNGEDLTAFQLQWRYAGDSWSGNVLEVDEPCVRHAVDDTSRGVEARARSRNAQGWGDWSATGSVDASDLLGLGAWSVVLSRSVSQPFTFFTVPAGVSYVAIAVYLAPGSSTTVEILRNSDVIFTVTSSSFRLVPLVTTVSEGDELVINNAGPAVTVPSRSSVLVLG